MTIIYVLIPLSLLVLIIGIFFFFWAVNSEQYENINIYSKYILYENLGDKKNVDID